MKLKKNLPIKFYQLALPQFQEAITVVNNPTTCRNIRVKKIGFFHPVSQAIYTLSKILIIFYRCTMQVPRMSQDLMIIKIYCTRSKILNKR